MSATVQIFFPSVPINKSSLRNACPMLCPPSSRPAEVITPRNITYQRIRLCRCLIMIVSKAAEIA